MNELTSKEEIIEKINGLMIENFELSPEKLTPKAHFVNDLGLDSLDAVDMLVHLENSLGVRVDVERFKKVRSLDDIYNLVTEIVIEQSSADQK